MVETVQSEDDSENEECSVTSSNRNGGEETRNDLISSENHQNSSHNSFNGNVAEPLNLLDRNAVETVESEDDSGNDGDDTRNDLISNDNE
jgi:hypothetical protein